MHRALLALAFALGLVVATTAAAQTDAARDPARLAGTAWRWTAFSSPVETITVPDPEHHTLAFTPDGSCVALCADCNRGAAAVAFPEPHRIAVATLALTRAIRPAPSLGARFAREVSRATVRFERGGELLLELRPDSGTPRFRPAMP